MFLMSLAKKAAFKNRPRVCSPGNMAVQTNPHAKVLSSRIIYSVGAIFGSGIFFADDAVGDERDFRISH